MILYSKLIKAFQTLNFICSRLLLLGISLLIFNTEVAANELSEVDYYNNIYLINGISNEYAKNIKTIAKKRRIRKKQNNKRLKRRLAKKNAKQRRRVVKKQVKRRNIAKKKPFKQTHIYEVNNCNKKASALLRNGIESCFDVATDVPTYTRPINLNSEYLSLDLGSKPVDLGLTPSDTGKIMLFGKNVNVLNR